MTGMLTREEIERTAIDALEAQLEQCAAIADERIAALEDQLRRAEQERDGAQRLGARAAEARKEGQ